MKLSSQARQVLDEYKQRNREETARMQQLGPSGMAIRDEFLLPVGEDVGNFLHTLIISTGAKNIVEIGTSYGYSTLFLADAARLTGGVVTTLELADYKQDYARDAMTRAGLEEFVDWKLGDALELLPHISRPVDFVLIDLWKELYIPCLELVYPKLAHGALIVADNVLFPEIHRADALAYQERVRSLPDIINSQVLELGSGIEVSCCWRD